MLLNPSFMADFTTNLQVVSDRSYQNRSKNMWWDKVATKRRSSNKREILGWLLNQWKLHQEATDGNVEFEDAIQRVIAYEHKFDKEGLELFKSDFEDMDGNGVNIATDFVAKMGAEFAYDPQRRLAKLMISNPNAYDGLSFFNAAHPVSGKAGDTSMGTYSNVISAKPIDTSVTVDVARMNLGSAVFQATAIKAPDGSPRGMQPVGLLVPGALATRASDLLGAKFIGGSGSTDNQPVLTAWNLGMPLVSNELGAAYGGSDVNYYLILTDTNVNEIGAFIWSVREDYSIKYPTLQDALYQEANKLRWVAGGRTQLVPGHPFALVKVTP